MRQDLFQRVVLPASGVVAGSALGVLCARVVLVGSGLSLIPWALVGLTLGALSDSRRGAAVGGALYGFALAYVFMVTGYDGAEPLHTRLVPFLVFGVLGAGCGAMLAAVGRTLRGRRDAHAE